MPPRRSRSPESAEPLMTVTLKQMAAELADGHNLPKNEAEVLLTGLMTLLIQHLKNGHRVRLTGLGLLHVRRPPPQRGLNLQTGEVIEIRGKGEIVFQPAKELKEVV